MTPTARAGVLVGLPLGLLVGLLAGCSAAPLDPVPPPEGTDATMLALRVRLRPPPRTRSGRLAGAWFVQLPGGRAPSQGARLRHSTVARGNVVYLLNAPPGAWAAVAIEELRDGRTRTTWLPGEAVAATRTELAPGAAAVVGTLRLAQEPRGVLDEAQARYRMLVRDADPDPDRWPAWLGTPREFTGRNPHLDAGPDTRDVLADDARSHLGEAGWPARPAARAPDLR